MKKDPQEARRAGVAGGAEAGSDADLKVGLPGAGGDDDAARRAQARIEHETARREVVRQCIEDDVAGDEPGAAKAIRKRQ